MPTYSSAIVAVAVPPTATAKGAVAGAVVSPGAPGARPVPVPVPIPVVAGATPGVAPGALDRLKARIPDHARDLRINLGVIATATALSPQQAWGTALTAAITARSHEVAVAIEDAAAEHLSQEAVFAARGAASIMAMNNIYYRFLHMMGDGSEYAQMPARLRMQLLAKPGVDGLDFELWCLAASAINGCEMCVRSHESSVRERRGTSEQVHEAVRIAAVVHAVALTLASAPVDQSLAR